MLLADASAFVLKVSKGLSNISGAGVLHVDTDTSVCVALITVWGSVSDLGGRGICPQVGEGCEEGIGSLCEPVRPLIHGSVHGHLSNGGEGGMMMKFQLKRVSNREENSVGDKVSCSLSKVYLYTLWSTCVYNPLRGD